MRGAWWWSLGADIDYDEERVRGLERIRARLWRTEVVAATWIFMMVRAIISSDSGYRNQRIDQRSNIKDQERKKIEKRWYTGTVTDLDLAARKHGKIWKEKWSNEWENKNWANKPDVLALFYGSESMERNDGMKEW